jgi:hypothetical protein
VYFVEHSDKIFAQEDSLSKRELIVLLSELEQVYHKTKITRAERSRSAG